MTHDEAYDMGIRLAEEQNAVATRQMRELTDLTCKDVGLVGSYLAGMATVMARITGQDPVTKLHHLVLLAGGDRENVGALAVLEIERRRGVHSQ
jgi:hypothetical protein